MIRERHSFRAVHLSGYHRATVAQVRAELDRHRANPTVALITGTENYKGEHNDAWREKGWRTFRTGELTITWRTAVLASTIAADPPGWARQLSERTFHRGTGQPVKGLFSGVVRLQHTGTGRRVIVRWAHMPASVQAGSGWSKTLGRVLVYRDAMRTWRSIVRLTLRNHPDAVLIVAADWNLDHGRKWVRSYLRRHLAPLRPALAHEGTLGNREIDVPWVHGAAVSGVEVHRRAPGHDHKAKSYRLTLEASG